MLYRMAFTDQLFEITKDFSGTIGLYALRLEDGFSLSYHAQEVFPAASVIKLHLLIAALQQVQNGQLELQTRIMLPEGEIVLGSGLLQKLEVGAILSLKDYLTLMIIVSDNTATNMVIDILGGREPINTQLETWDLGSTRVVGKLMLPPERKNEAQKAGKMHEIVPLEVVRMLEKLHRGQLLNPELTALALEILKKQEYTEMIGRLLPTGTITATKSGQIIGVRNDVGFVFSSQAYALAICSKGCSDLRYHIDNEAIWTIAKVSKLIFDVMQS
jgi:beta-lactamase class A